MRTFLERNKESLLVLLYSLGISFIILLFTSKCSFLYPFNDWVDANAFFTMGKSLMNGIVPYLDIFEQKGIILYLIYGIGYLMSNTSFIGIFVLETLSWTITLYFIYKISNLFLNKKYTLIILPFFMSILCISRGFIHGGSAEEFCYPLIAITMYYFLKHFKTKEINYKELFICGLLAGIVLLIKYTLLGFWFAFMLCLFIDFLMNKKYKKSVISCLVFLGGMFIPFGVSLIYFGIHGGIKEFIDVYFLTNITAYQGGTSLNLLEKVFVMLQGYLESLFLNNIIVIICVILPFLTMWKINIKQRSKVFIIIMFLLTLFTSYFGLKFFHYYIFPSLFFILFGFIGLFSLFPKNINSKLSYFFIIISILGSLLLSNYGANYKEFRNIKKEDLFQYQYAKIINREESPTLLNIGHLDCGLYTTTGIIPTTYFFEKQNIPYENFPDNLDAFQEYIKNKEVMFIIYYGQKSLEEIKKEEYLLFENYDLIETREQPFEELLFRALLFKVKE